MTNFNQTRPVKQIPNRQELTDKENDFLVQQFKNKQRKRLHEELSLRLQAQSKVTNGR